MINIAKIKYALRCPGCEQEIEISIQEIADQAELSCKHCSQRLKVVDEGGHTKKGITKVNRILKNLDDQLAKLCA